jgi:hypothetical protein
MPTIDVRIILPETIEIPTELADVWASHLKAVRELIYARATTKIDSVEDYKEYLAYPAYIKWKDFVYSGFPKADYIKLKFYIKVYGGGEDWLYNMYYAFLPGYAFETGVENKKGKWFRHAEEAIRTNRPRYLFWGVAEFIALGLTGDTRAAIYFEKFKNDYPDYVTDTSGTGAPVFEPATYIKPALANEVRPQIIDVITQAFMYGIYAYRAGGDTFASSVITGFSPKLKEVIQSHLDSGVTLDIAEFSWDTSKHRPAVLIKVSK